MKPLTLGDQVSTFRYTQRNWPVARPGLLGAAEKRELLAPLLRQGPGPELDAVLETLHVVRFPGLPLLVMAEAEHEDYRRGSPLADHLDALVGHRRTLGVVVEYFPPELEQHLEEARRQRISASALLKAAGYFDVWHHYDQLRQHEKDTWLSRTYFGDALGKLAAHHDKPVYTGDIADKPGYMYCRQPWRVLGNLAYDGDRGIEVIYEGADGALLAIPTAGPAAMGLLVAGVLGAFGLAAGGRGKQPPQVEGRGAFDRDAVHPFESVRGGLEDGRRVILSYLLQGILKDAQRIHGSGASDERVVLVYPKAHVLRLANYLANPDFGVQLERSLKALATRVLTPGCEHHADRFEAQDDGTWVGTKL